MTGWAFHAIGVPATQGSKRHVGHGVIVEASKKTAPWRDTITSAAFGAGPKLAGPVAIRAIFTLARPKSAAKHTVFPSTSRFDVDKCLRAALDSTTAAGLWGDDGQVAEVDRLAKVFPGRSFDMEALPVPGLLMAAVQMEPGWRSELHTLINAELRKVWARVDGPASKETALAGIAQARLALGN